MWAYLFGERADPLELPRQHRRASSRRILLRPERKSGRHLSIATLCRSHRHGRQVARSCIADPTYPQLLGRHRLYDDRRRLCRDRERIARHGRGAAAARSRHRVARLRQSAVLRAAHRPAHVRCARLLVPLHVHLRDARRQEPPRRDGAHPPARRAAVGARAGLSLIHRHVLSRCVSRQHTRSRVRGDLRHLHEPGLEHGVLVLPVAAHGAARPR